MIELAFLPINILKQVEDLTNVKGFLSRKQIAAACEVTEGTALNWSNKLPIFDLKVGSTRLWLPKTVAFFIKDYREKNNLPLA